MENDSTQVILSIDYWIKYTELSKNIRIPDLDLEKSRLKW